MDFIIIIMDLLIITDRQLTQVAVRIAIVMERGPVLRTGLPPFACLSTY